MVLILFKSPMISHLIVIFSQYYIRCYIVKYKIHLRLNLIERVIGIKISIVVTKK